MNSLRLHPEDLPSVTDFVIRHKRQMSLVMLAGLACTLAYFALATREYRSEAKFFLGMGREGVALDPTATTGKVVATVDTQDSEVYAVEELLKSRAAAETIVARFHLDSSNTKPGERRKSLGDYLSWLNAFNPNPLRVYSVRDKAIAEFQNNLKVATATKTNVVSVSYECDDPKLAQEALQALTALTRDEHVRIHRVKGSHEFFKTQTAELQRQLESANKKLRDAKNESQIVSIPSEQQAVQAQLSTIEVDALTTDASLSSTMASIASLKKSLGEVPEQVTTAKTVGFPNMALDYMQQEFFKLQTSVAELTTKLGEEHPLVKVARGQVQKLEDTLAKQAGDRTQTTTGINLSQQTLDLDLRRQHALAESLAAKGRVLKAQYAGLQDRLHKLNGHEMRLNVLERQIAIAATTYKNYAEHMEQARIDQQLQEAKISSLNLLQPPTFSATPASPRPIPTLALGFVLAAMSSVAVALLAERRSRRAANVSALMTSISEPLPSFAHATPLRRTEVAREPAISQ